MPTTMQLVTLRNRSNLTGSDGAVPFCLALSLHALPFSSLLFALLFSVALSPSYLVNIKCAVHRVLSSHRQTTRTLDMPDTSRYCLLAHPHCAHDWSVQDYDGGTLMECHINDTVPYLAINKMIENQQKVQCLPLVSPLLSLSLIAFAIIHNAMLCDNSGLFFGLTSHPFTLLSTFILHKGCC